MLKQRIATALILIAFLVGVLFYIPKVWFSTFIGVVVLAAAWEWSNLAGLQSVLSRSLFVIGTGLLLLFTGYYLVEAPRESQVILMGSTCVWWLIAFLWVKTFPITVTMWGNCWVKMLMGWFILVPTWLAMAILLDWQAQDDNSGRWILLTVIVIVILMDTGAYTAGRLFGHRKLAPHVSPGKTWAGVYGGLTVNAVLLALLGWQLEADAQLWLLLVLTVAATASVSVLGDLVESMVKRQRNVKDSGTLLPGHGGILDRVDGMTAAFPIFTLIYLLSDGNALPL